MDKDLVERELVVTIDDMVNETKDDPWTRVERFKDLQAEYLKDLHHSEATPDTPSSSDDPVKPAGAD